MSKVKEYICVDRNEMEADYYHANWMTIHAVSRNIAKVIYSKLNHSRYIDCVVRLKK